MVKLNYTKISNVTIAECPKGHLNVGQMGMTKYHGNIYYKCAKCGKLYHKKQFKMVKRTVMVPHKTKGVFK